MCLVISKPIGMPMPSNKRMKFWFDKYPDGIGLAFQDQGKVRILKGAMTHKQMFGIIANMKKYLHQQDLTVEDVVVLIQFRAAFTGRVCAEFTHPFPVTKSQKDLDSLNVVTEIALAHNGIIWEYNKTGNHGGDWAYQNLENINDAQEFIKDYLVGMGDSIWNPSVQRLIEEHTYSKFALLSTRGIAYIGEFIGDGGYFYSNDGYLKRKPIPVTYYKKDTQKTTPSTESYQAIDSRVAWQNESEGDHCDLCGAARKLLYELPDDDQSIICWDCYKQMTGGIPTLADRAI